MIVLTSIVTAIVAVVGLVVTIWKNKDEKIESQLRIRKLEQEAASTRSKDGDDIDYYERHEATPKMYKDITISVDLVFIGISNSKLATEYLKNPLDEAVKNRKPLPAQDVEIYFSSNAIGYYFENNNFADNVVRAVKNVAVLLTSSAYRNVLPDLKRLSFRQAASVVHYGGSLFRSSNAKTNFEGVDFSVIYNVFSMPDPAADMTNAFTIRVVPGNPPGFLYKTHLQSYNNIKQRSKILFSMDIGTDWDLSAELWDSFEDTWDVYKQIMRKFLDFGNLATDHSVIDLGCGTGRISKPVAQRLVNGCLVLLDNSPQMVSKAEQYLHEYGNVRYLVADARERLYGSYQDKHFDRIMVHFSFQSIIDGHYSVQRFAAAWKKHLRQNGEILIAIHNSCLADKEFQHPDWEDPLRRELKLEAQSKGFSLRAVGPPELCIADITAGFASEGLTLNRSKTESFPRTMDDRIAMWRVPAILDTMIDINGITDEQREQLLDSVEGRVKKMQTMPTEVAFLSFTKTEA